MAPTARQAVGQTQRLMLIALEGPGGAGKSTLVDRMLTLSWEGVTTCSSVAAEKARDKAGCLVDYTRDHGACLDGLERFLVYAARTAVKARLAARLASSASALILVDRFEISLRVLGTAVLGLDDESVATVVDVATRRIQPDRLIFLDVSYSTYRERVASRNEQAAATEELHRTLRSAFRCEYERCTLDKLWLDTTGLDQDEVIRTAAAWLRHC